MDALLKQCDATDGLADGMISDPLACHFDPAMLCKPGQSDACIAPEKVAAIKKAFAGPKNAYGTQIYPGFLYDTGITSKGGVPGLLAMGQNGLFGPYPTITKLDVDKAALLVSDPLVEPASTNLTTFSGNGGKLIFFHGDSDPWFSALDTLGYYQSLAETNGGAEKVSEWSRIFLVPGMAHCGGGPSLDHFDMLTAVVADDLRKQEVDISSEVRRQFWVRELEPWRGQRQHTCLDIVPVHHLEMGFKAPVRRGKAIDVTNACLLKGVQINIGENMRMNIDG